MQQAAFSLLPSLFWRRLIKNLFHWNMDCTFKSNVYSNFYRPLFDRVLLKCEVDNSNGNEWREEHTRKKKTIERSNRFSVGCRYFTLLVKSILKIELNSLKHLLHFITLYSLGAYQKRFVLSVSRKQNTCA